MSREEIQKLLGGYATDTLSEEESRALFEAALNDQELFDALAKEQALREVLQDGSARRELIAALAPARESFGVRAGRWMRRPTAVAMAGGLAALAILGGAWWRGRDRARPEAYIADATAPSERAVPKATPLPPAPAVSEEQRVVALRQSPRLEGRQEMALKKALANAKYPTGTVAPPPVPVPQMQGAPAIRALDSLKGPPAGGNAPVQAPMALGRIRTTSGSMTVDYTLLLRNDSGDYVPVAPGTVFHAGDSVRLQIEPGQDGTISLFQREDAGAAWSLVGSEEVQKARRYVLPATGGLQSNSPGQIDLMLELSRAAADAAGAGGAVTRQEEVQAANKVSTTPAPGASVVHLLAAHPAEGRATFRILVEYR